MAKIEKAKNHEGKTIFPVTVSDAVLMGNGKTLKGELSELGSKVGRGVITLKLTENHSSSKDRVPVDVIKGDVVVINQFKDAPTQAYAVYFYNSKTGNQESHALKTSEQNKVVVGGDYDSMGFYIGVNEPVNITIEYFTPNDFKSVLNSGVMGIVGKEDGMLVPNIDSSNGDMSISSSIGLVVNGFNYQIPPQTFNLKNNVPSSLTKIIYNTKTEMCKAIPYIEPVGRYEVVIGTARTKYSSDGSYKGLYHVYFPFEYSIDGKTIQMKIDDIDSKANSFVLFGDGSNKKRFAFTNIISGHSYRLYCKNPNWDISELSLSSDQAIFEINVETDGVSKNIYTVSFGEKGTIKDYYDFNIDSNLSPNTKLVVAIRGNKGVGAYFAIEDSTNIIFDIKNDRNNMFFIGDNYNFVSTKFRGIEGRKYKIHLLNSSWNYPSGIANDVSVFSIEASTNEGNVSIKRYTKNDSLPSSYTFEYKEGYREVYIGGRANRQEKVFFAIEDITEKPFRDSFTLIGDGNNGVVERIYLKEGVEYTILLPENKWNTDSINLGYNYYYYDLQYRKEGESSNTIVNGLLSNETYNSRFSFVAPETAMYEVFIRANRGVEVPVFVFPYATSVYEGQIEKIRSLGFKRNPNTADSNYTPNLVFMHMSDTHCEETRRFESFKKSVELFNIVSRGSQYYGNALKFILHTGDVRNAEYSDGYGFFEPVIKNLKKNIYVTPGNHDVGNGYTVANAGTNEDIYNQMIAPMLDKWNLNSDGVDSPHIEGKNYYFNDFTDEKIRMIVLYEYETNFDISTSNPTLLVHHRGYRAFSQGQIDWLIQTLKNTPQGYGVIIAKHQPESVDGFTDNPFYSSWQTERTHMQSYCGTELIAQIVQAFIDRTVFNTTIQQTGGIVTTLNVAADFSSLASSEFICYCSGHTHLDMINKLKNYPKQIELNIGPNNTHYTNGTDIYQNGEGVTRLLTNVYSIDRNRGYIYVVRLGANFSNTAQYRDFISLKYK